MNMNDVSVLVSGTSKKIRKYRYMGLGLCFLVSIFFVYILLLLEYQNTIQFAQYEIIGTKALTLLRDALKRESIHEMLWSRTLSGKNELRDDLFKTETDLEKAIQKLQGLESKEKKALRTHVGFEKISSSWKNLKEALRSGSSDEVQKAYGQLKKNLRKQTADFGDSSNLILDPDLDSYYFMDVVLIRSFEIQDRLTDVVVLSIQLADSGGVDPMLHTDLQAQLNLLQNEIEKGSESFHRAFENLHRKSLREPVKTLLDRRNATSQSFLNFLNENVLTIGSSPTSSEAIHQMGMKFLSQNYELWEETQKALGIMLLDRANKVAAKRNVATLFTLILLGLAVFFALVTARADADRRKATEESLRLTRALDFASDGIVMTDPNLPDNPVIYANKSFSILTGYAPSEVLGRNCRFLRGPGSDPNSRTLLRQAILDRKPIKITLLNYRKNGTPYWSGLRISPVFFEDGRIRYFLGFSADVTERMKMEAQLIKERDYNTALIRGAPFIICGIDSDGKTTFVNPMGESITGYAAWELVGKNWWNTFYPGDEYKQVEKLFEDFKHGEVRDYEMTLTCKKGQKRTILWNSMIRRDKEGNILEIIGFGNDVTEGKKLEFELQQSQKMETVGTLAGGIAHDLNNQLTPLQGFLNLLLSDVPEEDPKRELIWEADRAAKRCTEVVQRLLNVSRTSNQKKTWLALKNLMSESEQLFSKIIPSTIKWNVSCSDDIWPVLANETDIQTVLMNLVVNGRDAMDEGGQLIIKILNIRLDETKVRAGHKPGNYVQLSVTDTGKGIAPENLSKIFDPFYTTKPKGKGTGLGLAMVFRVVHDHGGWVTVSSQANQGTTFDVFLPAYPDAKTISMREESDAGNLVGGSETILFVDDEESLRQFGQKILEKLGYRVILAADGHEACEIYRNRSREIDAVVLDMTMPKMTGRQALKNLLDINPKAKILLSSGFTAEGTAKELISEGAKDFLPKPYTISPFSKTLRSVIDR